MELVGTAKPHSASAAASNGTPAARAAASAASAFETLCRPGTRSRIRALSPVARSTASKAIPSGAGRIRRARRPALRFARLNVTA